jgi:hypothetical protein
MIMNQSKPARSSKGKWTALVLILVVVAAAVGGWYFFLRATPEKAVRGFLEASDRRDINAMKSHLSAQSVRLINQFGGKMSPDKMFPRRTGKTPDYVVGKATIQGERATVPVTAAMPKEAAPYLGGKSQMEVPFVVIREEGKWKVDLIETSAAMMGAAMKEMMKGMMSQPGKGGMPGMGGLPGKGPMPGLTPPPP